MHVISLFERLLFDTPSPDSAFHSDFKRLWNAVVEWGPYAVPFPADSISLLSVVVVEQRDR
jgi:hypothetical protein